MADENTIKNEEGPGTGLSRIDLSKLLGFRTLPDDPENATDLTEAMAVTHNKIGEAAISDERLKSNVKFRETAASGLRLYDFRYVGDERTFVGVMAQDLLKDAAHARAVAVTDSGYYQVDYAALGLSHLVTRAMREAGAQALSAASGRRSA